MIGILDDDVEGRVPRMIASLAPIVPTTRDNAPAFLDWLKGGLPTARLLSLDHDLGPSRARDDGERWDPGTGMDVVDYLVTQKPSCPVIVHSSNPISVPVMIMRLEEAGWSVHRAVPISSDWIETDWIRLVKSLAP